MIQMSLAPNVVAVIGLGYVGPLLAIEFGKKYRTIGLDLSEKKVAAYRRHEDPTGEVASDLFRESTLLSCGSLNALCVTAATIVRTAGNRSHGTKCPRRVR